MNQPPEPPYSPSKDHAPKDEDVAVKQARMEQMVLESRLEIVRTQRQQRESKVSRRLMFITCFAVSAFMAFMLDKKGYSPQLSFFGCVLTFVLIATWWTYKKPY